METNQSGIDLIRKFEGFRAKVYRCPAGYPTIGYGHRIKQGETLRQVTEQQAQELLHIDLKIYESAVISAVHVPLNPNQFSALVSFCYNVGPGNFRNSSIVRYLNQGRYQAASARLLLWNKARVGGVLKPLRGLTARRMEERALFDTPIESKFEPLALQVNPDHPIDFSSYECEDETVSNPPIIQNQKQKPPIGGVVAFVSIITWVLTDVLGISPEYVQYIITLITPYLQEKGVRGIVIIALTLAYLYKMGYLSNIKARIIRAVNAFKHE